MEIIQRIFNPYDCAYLMGRRPPSYFQYVCARACHWLINFNLTLAQLAEPKKEWRIVTSRIHSTVWDGNHTLFDLNGLVFYSDDASECLRSAALQTDSVELGLGELYKVGLPLVDHPQEIVGLRLKPIYHVPNKYLCLFQKASG